ncbi:MAG: YfhO family protein [Paludibacteraceae bacterium]|nr:YfhO family protein [Paludibacteraceae bacterium]
MKSFVWKKLLPYLVALVVFVGLAFTYCAPQFHGKVLMQGDINTWRGAAKEAQTYYDEHGEPTGWTNSMFSGMPTYQITFRNAAGAATTCIKNELAKGLGEPITAILLYFIGFYVMLLCFGINPWLSLVGSLALGLSSYFFLIIPAGHMTKAFAIGGLAPVIGGIYAIFRKRYWLGVPILLVFGSYSLVTHPQMSYYVFMLIGVLCIAELYQHIRERRWKDLGIGVGLVAICLGLVFLTKLSWWQLNHEYLGETMRGGHSELTQNDTTSTSKVGLDLTYATDWSYGRAETMTLLIPNWEGGASGYNVGKDSQLCKTMRSHGVPKRDAEQFCRQVPTYHGEKAFTSGAVYVGAVVCFLFLLALIIVPGPYKWALLFATIASILLAWGKNMMWLTEFFFNHFPMYNKFRAVESILVVAEITMPLLAFLGLQRIVEGKVEWKKLRLGMLIAGGVTAALCLYTALFAGGFDMHSSYDAQWTDKMPDWLIRAIMDERVAMVKADAWRSLLFVSLGFVLTYWYAWYNKDQKESRLGFVLYAGLALLILADMVPVDKRFFNDDNFISKRENDAYFKIQPYEEEILKDSDLDYRVLNLAANTFNDSRTSYRLKSIGGYHAAKLRRYQDVIEAHISPEMNLFYQALIHTQGFLLPDEKQGADFPVLNMLNTRYAVIPMQDGSQAPIRNPYAMGNAWFVENVQFVPTPDDESMALNTLDLHKTAVADERFRDVLTCSGKPDTTDQITLIKYEPNQLEYTTHSASDRVAVFSEIYYPYGWHLTIDGQEAALGRANYLLRAAVIPAGDHTVKMEFLPTGLATDRWCMGIVIFIYILSALLLCYPLYRNRLCKTRSSKDC